MTGAVGADHRFDGLFDGRALVAVAAPSDAADKLFPEERALVALASGRRRRSFIAGRRCAHRLLRSVAGAAGPLLSDAEGVPVWPPGIVGSISHCPSLSVAAVAPTDAFASIGVDITPQRPLPRELWTHIASPAELGWIEADGRRGAPVRARCLFAAKEAAYKAQFPVTRTKLSFREVSIRVRSNVGRFVWSVPWSPEADPTRRRCRGGGRFVIVAGHALAGAWPTMVRAG